MSDERKKQLAEQGVMVYSGDDEVPSDLLNSKVVYTFSINQVERDGEQYLGIHVQWPEGTPDTWPKNRDEITDPQIIALLISRQLEQVLNSILPKPPVEPQSTNGKSMAEFMEELNSIDPDAATKH